MKETILIVDDEEDIIEFIKYNLVNEGYSTLSATTGEQAIALSEQAMFDLIVLDLMLPGMDGLEVTRRLRNNEHTHDIPIVMLTARGDESDIVTGLESGATDYMLKPFSHKELIARIRAILRTQNKQRSGMADRISNHANIVLDRGRYVVLIDGRSVNLTLTEFELLSFLSAKKGWVFTRGQIVDAIHGSDYAVTERSVDVIIVGLRKKLSPYSHFIETVRGVGYRFKE